MNSKQTLAFAGLGVLGVLIAPEAAEAGQVRAPMQVAPQAAPAQAAPAVQYIPVQPANNSNQFDNDNITRNEQSGKVVANQTAVYNVGNAARTQFHLSGAQCSSPVMMVSANVNTYGWEWESTGWNASFAYVHPMTGDDGKNCTRIGSALANFHEFRSEIELARGCSELIANGVALDAAHFPNLATKCQGVRLAARPQAAPAPVVAPPAPVHVPEELPPVIRRTRG